MKSLSLVVAFALCATLVDQVFPLCHYTTIFYHDCKYYSSRKGGEWSFSQHSNDSFYEEELGKIKNFKQAMDLFKSHYDEVQSCKQDWCECARYHFSLMGNHSAFFTDAQLYPQMYQLLDNVKTNYTLLSMEEISKQTEGFHFDEFFPDWPTLNDYCHKYDFSIYMFFFYKQTFEYQNIMWKGFGECLSNFVTLNSHVDWRELYKFPKNNLEMFTGCLASGIKSAPNNIQHGLVLAHLYDYPDITKGNENNLGKYIESLENLNTKLFFNRSYLWFHTDDIKSQKKNVEQNCALTDGKTYNLFTSPKLKIDGKIGQGGRTKVLTQVTVTFIWTQGTTRNYTTSTSSFKRTFGDNSNSANISTGNGRISRWLEITYYDHSLLTGKEGDFVVIGDYSTNTTISIHLFDANKLTIEFEPTFTMANAPTSGGIFINGCPSKRKRSASSVNDFEEVVMRKRRETLENRFQQQFKSFKF